MPDAVYFLINPGSSRADAAPLARLAAQMRGGVTCLETSGPEDLRERIDRAAAEGVGRIIVAGGDGTIHLAVNALMAMSGADGSARSGTPSLGIVPLGTANDLARSLGLPLNPSEAFAVAAEDSVRAIDVLRITRPQEDGGRPCYAINAITGGLSVRVHDQLDDEVKKWWGGFAYAKAMFEVIGDAPDHRVTLEADGEQLGSEAFGLVVANGPRAGGQHLVPPARLDDGLAEVLLAHGAQGGERLKLLAEFAAGRHLDSPRVRSCQARQVTVRAQPPMPLIADGERCGQTPVVIDVLPGAVRIATPPPEPASA